MTTPTASTDHRGTVSIQPPARRGHDTRMDKRFLVCGLMMSLAAMLLGVLVHGGLLRADYLAHAALYRDPAEANARLVWIVVAYALIGFSMTWLFRRMYPERRVRARDGLQFGLAIALVSFLPWHLLAYVGQPLPSGLLARQVLSGAREYNNAGVSTGSVLLCAVIAPR